MLESILERMAAHFRGWRDDSGKPKKAARHNHDALLTRLQGALEEVAGQDVSHLNFGKFRNALKKVCGAQFELSDAEHSCLDALFGSEGYIRHGDFVRSVKELHGNKELERFSRELSALLKHASAHSVDVLSHFSRHDPDGSGLVGRTEFAAALAKIGVDISKESLERLTASYQGASNKAKVMYKLFLEDMAQEGVKPWQVAASRFKDSLQAQAARVDVIDKLQELAHSYMLKPNGGFHDIWMALEKHDEELGGWITLDKLSEGFQSLGFPLSNVDRRRLQLRFPVEGHSDRVRYRDLLSAVLKTRGAATSVASEARLAVGAAGAAGAAALTAAAATASAGPENALEFLQKEELDELLERLLAIRALKPFDVIDMRDVFEQFDFELTGLLGRDDFLKCVQWVGLVRGGIEAIGDRHRVTRLANFLEMGSEGKVSYRKLFVLLADFERHAALRRDTLLQKSHKELQELVSAVKSSVGSLKLSGIDFAECFRMADADKSGTLSHREFHQALESLNVKTSLVTLPRALRRFEKALPRAVRHDDSDSLLDGIEGPEMGVNYEQFVEMVKLSLEEEHALATKAGSRTGQGTAAARESTESAHLNDSFEIIRTLRSYVREASSTAKDATLDDVVRRCFEDLDLANDGAVQESDLVEGAHLLGIVPAPGEIRRVMNFPYLFRTPETGGAVQALEPRSPWELAEAALAARPSRVYEMSLDLFRELLGAHKRPAEVRRPVTQRGLGDGAALSTLFALLQGQEDTHASRNEILACLRKLYLLQLEKRNLDLFVPFEALDRDMCGLLDEAEARGAMQEALGLGLSESESHKLFRRLGVVKTIAAQRATSVGSAATTCPESEVPGAAVAAAAESTLQVRPVAGAGRVRYRRMLQLILDHEDMAEHSVHFGLEDELFLEALRSHKDAQAVLERLREPPSLRSRREVWLLLRRIKLDGFKDNAKLLLLRLLRRFETEDELVDIERLAHVLHLEMCPKKQLTLRRVLAESGDEFKRVLGAFQGIDVRNTGAILAKDFKGALDGIREHLEMDEEELSRLCHRFTANPLHRARKAAEEHLVDYRSMLRYFTSSEAPRDLYLKASKDGPGLELEGGMTVDADTLERQLAALWSGSGIQEAAGMGRNLWKQIWGTQHAKPGTVGALVESTGKKAVSYMAWKVRKNLYDRAVAKIQELYPRFCQDEEKWLQVGLALAAISMHISVRCPEAGIPSLEEAFISWSKEHGKAFVKVTKKDGIEVQVSYTFDKEADASHPQNKEFVAQCRASWRKCEKDVKKKVLVFQIERRAGRSGEDVGKLITATTTCQTARGHNEAAATPKTCAQLLLRLGLQQLELLIREGEVQRKQDTKIQKKEHARERELHHQHFKKKKALLRVRVPKGEVASMTGWADPELQRLIAHAAGKRKYIHASNQVELQRIRQALVRSGHIFRTNYRDPDGDAVEEDYLAHKEQKRSHVRVHSMTREQGADHQFELWCIRKDAQQQAVRLLNLLDRPAGILDSSDDKKAVWEEVGRALKSIDPSGLRQPFADWSQGFASRAKCEAAWARFPPKPLEGNEKTAWAWEHLRSVLVKLFSKHHKTGGPAMRNAFQDVVVGMLPPKKREVAGARKAAYERALACFQARHFRTVMQKIGTPLRLHEEKRLMEFYPGVDGDGIHQPGTICMDTVLQIMGVEPKEGSGNDENPSAGWGGPHARILDTGERVALSIDEKVQQALILAGAPEDVCAAWRAQRASLQRGLIFLTALSRENRLKRGAARARAKVAVPPLRPRVWHEPSVSTQHSMLLRWEVDPGPSTSPVLFFSVERLVQGKPGGVMQMVAKDPPELTDPPSIPARRVELTDLAPNTTYEFRVIAFNKHGPSEPARHVAATLAPRPRAPSVSGLRFEGKTAVCRLSWCAAPACGDSPEECRCDSGTAQVPLVVLPEGVHEDAASIAAPSQPDALSRLGKAGGVGSPTGASHIRKGVTKAPKYEVLILQDGIEPSDAQAAVGLCVYRGHALSCDVVGLRSGVAYRFMVRSRNRFGEPGSATRVIEVTPLVPPLEPQVELTGPDEVNVRWKAQHGSHSGAGQASETEWSETMREWERKPSNAQAMRYEVQLRQSGGGASQRAETTKLETSFESLRVNASYRVRVRAHCDATGRGMTALVSPWSSWAVFATPPTESSAPVLVDHTDSSLVLRWFPPPCGATAYRLDILEVAQPDGQSAPPKWVTRYQGRHPLVVLPGLAPSTVFQTRVVAIGVSAAAGKLAPPESRPSLPLQCRTLSKADYRALQPSPGRAALDFTLQCSRHSLVLGDMIIFTEKSRLPCFRTIAGRVVIVQEDEEPVYWLQVEWSTVSSKEHAAGLVIPPAARIQRKASEIFEREVQLGVYRMPWADEGARR